MDNCDNIQESLGAYLDGELEGTGKAQMEQHLAECKQCSLELEKLKKMEQASRGAHIEMPQEREWQALWRRIDSALRAPVREEAAAWHEALVSFWKSLSLSKKALASVAAAGIIVILLIFAVSEAEKDNEVVFPLASSEDVIQSEVEVDTSMYMAEYFKSGEGVTFFILMKKDENEADLGLL